MTAQHPSTSTIGSESCNAIKGLRASKGLQPGQHELSYAYPSSPHACKAGMTAEGCYMVIFADRGLAFLTLAAAAKAGTAPGRWSIDHPLNKQILLQNSFPAYGAA